jgi:hypothetical protein
MHGSSYSKEPLHVYCIQADGKAELILDEDANARHGPLLRAQSPDALGGSLFFMDWFFFWCASERTVPKMSEEIKLNNQSG